jgi:hypothetical protein
MPKVLAFPRRNSVPTTAHCITDDAHHIICIFTTSWPEVGIYAGQRGLVERGLIFTGQVILIEYEGEPILCLLTCLDVDGNIDICDSEGETLHLGRGQYKIEGTLTDIFGRLKSVV